MDMEAKDVLTSLNDGVGRLAETATLLERTVAWLEERQASISGEVQKIVAAVEQSAAGEAGLRREQELERKLREAEQQIVELRAQASRPERKTIPTATLQLLAKQGVDTVDSIAAGTLDAALHGLSLEQRIAVKSQLLRAGVVA